MSSFVEKLEERALDALEKHGPDWFDKALSSGRKELGGLGGSNELDLLRISGTSALDALERHRARLIEMGYARTLAFLGRLSVGQTERAARLLMAYGGGKGAWGKADAKIVTAAERTEQEKRDLDDAIAIAKEIGSAAAKSAIPILMTMVKL